MSNPHDSHHGWTFARLAIVLTGMVFNVQVAAQGADAKCKVGFDWMSNSLGQSPCLMAAYLGAACSNDPASYILHPSVEGYFQSKASATVCTCNTVAYSLWSACSFCQVGAVVYETWDKWKANCSLPTAPLIGQFPEDIPNGTVIPAWAFYNVATTGIFNVTTAEAIAQQNTTEIAAPTPTMASSSAPPSSTAASSSASIPSASSNTTSGAANTVPIVGGVAGGVVLFLGALVTV